MRKLAESLSRIILGVILGIHYLVFVVYVLPDIPQSSISELRFAESLLEPSKIYIETRLKKEYPKFKKATIHVSDMLGYPDKTVGVTHGNFRILGYIKLRAKYLSTISEEVREALLLHEYGHFLGINNHNDSMIWLDTPYISLKCPKSVMHSTSTMEDCFYYHKDYYYKELIDTLVDINK